MSQRIPRDSLIGMQNCGNTCYFNSVIQMLFDIREFREGIIRSNSDEAPIPQLRRIFTQLKEQVVAEPYQKNYDITNFRKMKKIDQNLFLQNRSKILDVSKFMDHLNPWLTSCKLRRKTEFPGTQEDAAEFMQKCILNRFTGTPLIDPLEIVTKLRYDYVNFGTSREKKEVDAIPFVQLNVYYYKENEKISTLIENFFNIHHTQPNSETSKNFWERKVLQNNPNYMIFSFDRTSFTDDKIDRNIILEDSIPIGGEQYNLYSVVVHKGTTMNSGHYVYLFKENKSSWILFNDDRVSIISNGEFLTGIQKNVAIVCYKKASEDILIEAGENVRRLLPAPAPAPVTPAAPAPSTSVINLTKNKDDQIKETLSFLKGKTVYRKDLYLDFTITDTIIENGKIIGIRVKDYESKKFPVGFFVMPAESLGKKEFDILNVYYNDDKKKQFIIESQETINGIIEALKKSTKSGEGGGKRSTRRRKVDARKRKHKYTRKA